MVGWLKAGAAAVVFLAAQAAHAEVFSSAYAPRAGERAEVVIDKCRTTIRNGESRESCGRSIYLGEMLSVDASGGGRMRYTLQSIEPTGDDASAITPELERALENFTLLVTVDEAGFPTSLDNLDETMAHVRSLLASDDANVRRAVDILFERMDARGAAQLFTRDFAGVSMFQAIEAEVGKPVTGQVTMPFPVDPALTIDASATLLVESVDHASGRAHVSYTQIVDEASARPVIQTFVQRMMAASPNQPPDLAEQLAGMRMSRTDEWRAVVDIPSGRVIEMRSRADASVAVAGENRQTIETITLTRRMLPAQ
jgi:hypothetical protein